MAEQRLRCAPALAHVVHRHYQRAFTRLPKDLQTVRWLNRMTTVGLAFLPWLASAQAPSDAGAPRDATTLDAATLDAAAPVDAAADPDAEDDDADDDTADDGEEETPVGGPEVKGFPYTGDLSDEELLRLWNKDPAALGSITVGFADAGRIINGVQMPPGEGWSVVSPENAWGTRETIDALVTVINAVFETLPGGQPVRVNHISRKDGGYLRPHQSHQSGRDADLAFFYKPDAPGGFPGGRNRWMDIPRNWAVIRALATLTDVQVVLVDKKIQKLLYDHALSAGEDKDWLDSLFHAGSHSLVKHARRHKDHFHIRFFSPRAQELGRRVQPLLAQRPDQNLMVHRVRGGDTIGHLALKYGSTIQGIMKANGMKKSFLRLGQTLVIPLRGPCTQCPLPPAVLAPPRRVPPEKPAPPAPSLDETPH
jgi:murein endopeptidase